jgi:hypothetical protein
MLSSTEMADYVLKTFDDGEVHSTREGKAAVAALLTEDERNLQETNHRTGETTGKLKWEHEFHTALNRLKNQGKLERVEWGTFKIISRTNGRPSSIPAGASHLPHFSSNDPVALLAEVSAVVKKVGGTARLKQILEILDKMSAS